VSLQQRVEPLVLRALMGLPERVQRRLAGPPVTIDGHNLAAETQLMLRAQRVAREKPAETLPIEQGRAAIEHQSALVGGDLPIGDVRDIEVAGRPARLYVPSSERPSVALGAGSPLLVFIHGGGWVYGSIDSHDAPCRVLAERAGVRVLSVDYRLAPEDPHPAAYDDCLAAYGWVVEHASELGADPTRLGVGGDSAGANLAVGVAFAAAREGLPLAFQLLVYPGTDMTASMTSRETFAEGFFLTRDFMDLARAAYVPDEARWREPEISPLFADVPAGVAPAYVCTAGFDPLRDEGQAFVERLREAGVEVRHQLFEDQIHGFFNVVGVGRRSRACVDEIADALRAGLGATT
jgi:acetyl esterase